MTLYSIAGWEKHFEIYDAKRIDGPLKWVAVPTKTDGFGFSRIRMERDACQLLAAWYLMLGIAAKQDKANRGKLQRDGQPLTADDLELMTGFPAKVFSRAFDFFSKHKHGWLLAQEVPIDATSSAHRLPVDVASCAPTGQDRTGQDKTEQNRTLGCAAVAAPATDSEWLASLKSNPAYDGINIGLEYGKMQAWCGANRKQPSRRRFINWLNRAERPMQRQIVIGQTAKPIDGPTGWRETLARIRPGNTYEGAWATLPPSLQDEIRKSTA